MQIIPSFLVDKASCTRQFESELSLHSLASLFPIKEGIFSNPSVSLSKGSSTSNQAFSIVFTTPSVPLVGDRNLRRKDVTALLGAQNRYALRLADQSGLRHIVRDGTAWLLWGSACNYIVESECMEGAYRLRPPYLFLIAVSLCTCRHSNEEYYFYSTFERITSGEVPIRVMAEIL